MEDYMNYNYYQTPPPGPEMYAPPAQHSVIGMDDNIGMQQKTNEPPPPPPIVICPTEVDHINVTLEKNQQCECKDCGKLFNSVWYLKQHAVKHSNDRPFKCKFCFKTYKFRSNLYQHKCPERQKSLQQRRRGAGSILSPASKRVDSNQIMKNKMDTITHPEDPIMPFSMPPPQNCFSEGEDNDAPITYGLVIQNLDQSQMQQTNNFSMGYQPPIHPLMNDMENTFDKQADFDSVRGQQLPSQQIEEFVEKNKQKLFSCRKCRMFLPTEEALLRHSASHSGEDLFPYKCTNCRQAFENEKELRRHAQLHSLEEGPWRCVECCGQFRSSVALKRHKDQCRPCFLPPVQNNIMVSVHSPFDPFSFIPANGDHLSLPLCEDIARAGTDSGVGSEGSPNSLSQTSPDRSNVTLDETFGSINTNRDKDDDEDSGFRSRLNSVTQSCSPDSFSSHGDSPIRKLSGGPESHSSHNFLGGYGTGPAYGQQILFEQSVGGIDGEDHYGMIKEQQLCYKEERISFQSRGVVCSEVDVAPLVHYHISPAYMKEIEITSRLASLNLDADSWYDDYIWKNDGYDHPPEPSLHENWFVFKTNHSHTDKIRILQKTLRISTGSIHPHDNQQMYHNGFKHCLDCIEFINWIQSQTFLKILHAVSTFLD